MTPASIQRPPSHDLLHHHSEAQLGHRRVPPTAGLRLAKMTRFGAGILAGCLVAWTAPASSLAASFQAETRTFYSTADGLPSNDVRLVRLRDGRLFAATAAGVALFANGRFSPTPDLPAAGPGAGDGAGWPVPIESVRQTAEAPDGRAALAAAEGLFFRGTGGAWQALHPSNGARSWAPRDVRGVAFDARGRLWFASPQGAGCLDGSDWRLFTSADGLPYDDFTTMAAGEAGVVWLGTRRGAIRFDGRHWEYRQGPRWLPHDEVRSIAVEPDGTAWFATAQGVGRIERRPMTLAQKAAFFEDEIEKRHLRTRFGFVLGVTLERPGDTSRWTQRDSDNDGLWTAMYGAAQCFAWAATHSTDARLRAGRAFEALRFLGRVTQGGEHGAPPGFVARTVLPAEGPDPNATGYTRERDEERRKRDRLWKVIVPRWPKSADGRWYWKSDTSSDELDGHFFFYALFHDLVAAGEQERRAVREHVGAIADHLLRHRFRFVDHDGRPTRWGVFDPESLNHDPDWREERGLNSLSILSYLKVAEHLTGEARYGLAYRRLVRDHAYATNTLIPKSGTGLGSGNQSDDEMAFMNFYGLLRYEKDPALRQTYALALFERWTLERPELNPFFNFVFAASASGAVFNDAFGRRDLSPPGEWLFESLDTLRRYPLDRVDWRLTNSHRKDIVPLPEYARESGTTGKGYRNSGKVLPIDERFVEHWNHDPWQLDQGGEGLRLADGTSFLLPYYMGLYHRFIEPD